MIQVDDEIELRAVNAAMTEDLFKLVSREFDHLHEWMQWAVDGYTINHTRSFIEYSEKQWASGGAMNYAIFVRNELAGGAGLNVVDRVNKGTEIGYWLSSGHTGRGIVTRCVERLIELAFEDLGMHRVAIRCASKNVKSRAIPERLGFTKEGTMRESELLHTRYVDLVVYALLKRERKNQ